MPGNRADISTRVFAKIPDGDPETRFAEAAYAESQFQPSGPPRSSGQPFGSALREQGGTAQHTDKRPMANLLRLAPGRRTRRRDRRLSQGVRDEEDRSCTSGRDSAGGVPQATVHQPEPAWPGPGGFPSPDQRDHPRQARRLGRHGIAVGQVLRKLRCFLAGPPDGLRFGHGGRCVVGADQERSPPTGRCLNRFDRRQQDPRGGAAFPGDYAEPDYLVTGMSPAPPE